MGESENRSNKLRQVDIRRYGESARATKEAGGLVRSGAETKAKGEREGLSSAGRSGRFRRKRDRDEAGAQGPADVPEGERCEGFFLLIVLGRGPLPPCCCC